MRELNLPKFTIALLSFAAGLLISPVLGRVEATSQQPPVPSIPHSPLQRATIDHLVAERNSAPILPNGIPIIKSLTDFPLVKTGEFSHDTAMPLDGLDCETCSFEDALLVYGGGPFRLGNATFKGRVGVQLVGAAANTVALLQLIAALKQNDSKVPQPQSNKPIRKQAQVKRPPNKPIAFGAPFIGKQ